MKKSLKINASLNIIKQICSIVFPLITFPYISRVLEVENYGKYTFSTSIISYFSLIAMLGISSYAVREGAGIRDDKRSITKFCNEIFLINIGSTLLAYVLLVLTLWIVPFFKNYSLLIMILSVAMALTTFGTDWINTIYEEYDYLTVRYIVFQVLSIIFMFLFVRSEDDYYIYAAITVLASAGANICNMVHVRKFVHLSVVEVVNIKKHLKPMVILLCNSLAIIIYVNADITMLGFFSGDEAVGIYSIAVKVYTLVKQLICAVIIVLVPRLAYYSGQKMNDKYELLLNDIINGLILFMSPIIIGLFMLSDKIILFLGGEKYITGTFSLQILSFSALFSIMAYLFANLVLVLKKQEGKFLRATIIGATVNVVLNIFFIPRWGASGAAITTLIAELIVCVCCAFYAKKWCKLEIEKKFFGEVFVGCLAVVLVCMLITRIELNLFLSILLSVIFSSVVYFCIQLAFHNQVIIKFVDEVKKRKRC